MAEHEMSQLRLSQKTGVPQPCLSRFLSGLEIRSNHAIKLFSCVLLENVPKAKRRKLTPAAPATSPEASQVGGDAA